MVTAFENAMVDLGDPAAVASGRIRIDRLSSLLQTELAAVAVPNLRPLALLRGLCRSVLNSYFATTQDVLALAYGDSVPLVARSFGAHRPHVTPALATTCSEELLAGTTFRLYDRPAAKPVHVELDYRRRVALEQVAWPRSTHNSDAPEPWCPLVLTSLHPHGSFDTDIEWTAEGTRFFWVRPKNSDITSLLANLAAAALDEIPADIAVLPELALHHSDALGTALSAAPELYPPLVVAGSAHEEDDDGRRNRSRTYLEGVELLEQLKYHGLRLRHDEISLVEDLAAGPHVVRMACGTTVRLSVAICADLHDREVKDCLTLVGANLLLAPSMTPGVGGFSGALCGLASSSQAIGLVVNTVAPANSGQTPFDVLIGLPLPLADDQAHPESCPDGLPARAVVSPGLPASSRVSWRAWLS